MLRTLYALGLIFIGMAAWAQSPLQKVSEDKSVHDYADVLSSDEEKQLEEKIAADSSVKIMIVLTKDVVKKDAREYAATISKSWNLGDKSFLILSDVKHINYGFFVGSKLKNTYPDWVIEKIEHNFIRHNFREKKYFQGLEEATDIIAGLKSGSVNPNELKRDSSNYASIVLILIVVFFIIIFPIWQFRAMRNSHFSTKPMDFVSSVLLMNTFGSRGKNVFDDFTNAKGVFAPGKVKAQLKNSFKGGGGIAGSW